MGVNRSAATVLLRPNEGLSPKSFLTLRDGEKKNRLDRLNRLVSKLQHTKKYDALKLLRHKRKRVAEYFDRLSAEKLANLSEGYLLVVGNPKGIKYENFKGNGKMRLRRLLTRWSYGRIIRFIEERAERGLSTKVVDERWSSKTCWKRGSKNTERASQSTLWCWKCCKDFNADYNAAINISLPFLAKATGRGATVKLAQTRDEQAREIAACELGSQHPSGVGSSRYTKITRPKRLLTHFTLHPHPKGNLASRRKLFKSTPNLGEKVVITGKHRLEGPPRHLVVRLKCWKIRRILDLCYDPPISVVNINHLYKGLNI